MVHTKGASTSVTTKKEVQNQCKQGDFPPPPTLCLVYELQFSVCCSRSARVLLEGTRDAILLETLAVEDNPNKFCMLTDTAVFNICASNFSTAACSAVARAIHAAGIIRVPPGPGRIRMTCKKEKSGRELICCQSFSPLFRVACSENLNVL